MKDGFGCLCIENSLHLTQRSLGQMMNFKSYIILLTIDIYNCYLNLRGASVKAENQRHMMKLKKSFHIFQFSVNLKISFCICIADGSLFVFPLFYIKLLAHLSLIGPDDIYLLYCICFYFEEAIPFVHFVIFNIQLYSSGCNVQVVDFGWCSFLSFE